MASLALASAHTLASNEFDSNVLCAAYMDIAVKDLYPVGAIQRAKALEMTTGRFTRLAATTMLNDTSIDEVITDFTVARDYARGDLFKRYPAAASSAQNLYNYARGIDVMTNKYCIPSNSDLMQVVQTHSKQDLINQAIAVSKAMKARGES